MSAWSCLAHGFTRPLKREAVRESPMSEHLRGPSHLTARRRRTTIRTRQDGGIIASRAGWLRRLVRRHSESFPAIDRLFDRHAPIPDIGKTKPDLVAGVILVGPPASVRPSL